MNQEYTELQVLENRRERLLESLAMAVKARNEADGKMQSRYDTQKEDAAQDVAMYEALIADLDLLIAQVMQVRTSPTNIAPPDASEDPVQMGGQVMVGKRVTIRFDGGDCEEYLLLDSQGGVELGTCQTLSTISPVGQLILGSQVGEVRRLRVKDESGEKEIAVEVEILGVSNL
jgi:transcription elongation GreA/GreB family factor